MSKLTSAATALFFLSIAIGGGYVWKLHKQLDPALERPINIIASAPVRTSIAPGTCIAPCLHSLGVSWPSCIMHEFSMPI